MYYIWRFARLTTTSSSNISQRGVGVSGCNKIVALSNIEERAIFYLFFLQLWTNPMKRPKPNVFVCFPILPDFPCLSVAQAHSFLLKMYIFKNCLQNLKYQSTKKVKQYPFKNWELMFLANIISNRSIYSYSLLIAFVVYLKILVFKGAGQWLKINYSAH